MSNRGDSSTNQRRRSTRIIEEYSGPLDTEILDEIEGETVFYPGPPRIQLMSPPIPGPRTPGGQTRRSSRVHSFSIDSTQYTSVTTGDVPFMLVGPRQNQPDNQPSSTSSSTNHPDFPTAANLMNSAQQQQQFFGTGQNLYRSRPVSSSANSPLRNKIVYELHCCYCQNHICGRAMRAILLADTKVELYSTDIPPSQLRLLDDDRMTQGCNCRIRDTACSTWYKTYLSQDFYYS